jgi:hypothetical protein
LVGWWAVSEQHDNAVVVVALVEYLACVQHTLARRDAFVLVDGHFHVRGTP